MGEETRAKIWMRERGVSRVTTRQRLYRRGGWVAGAIRAEDIVPIEDTGIVLISKTATSSRRRGRQIAEGSQRGFRESVSPLLRFVRDFRDNKNHYPPLG